MSSSAVAEIDWTRMAAPQADGYDTAMILRLAAAAAPPLRSGTCDPRPLPHLGDNPVTVAPAPERGLMSERIGPAAPDHPNLVAAASYLGRWPTACHQFAQLIDTIYPYSDPAQAAQGDWSLGSSSHSYENQWGRIYATVDDALGLAQALIHETAHQKLNALGVYAGRAGPLIANDVTELHAHPHFALRRQPMTAVFHEQYTFIHVAALDLHMLRLAVSERERQRILMLLARNITRMEAGHEEIGDKIRCDREGALFVGAFLEWSKAVLAEGRAELDAGGYAGPN